MTAPLYDDEPARDAELIAAAWADEMSRAHVGRHRHPDDDPDSEILADLVAWRLACVHGDRDLADAWLYRAQQRLYRLGHTPATAMVFIHAAYPAVKAEAQAIRNWWDRPTTEAP